MQLPGTEGYVETRGDGAGVLQVSLCYCLTFDGSFIIIDHPSGTGFSVQDSANTPLWLGGGPCEAESRLMAEVLALWEGLEAAELLQ